MYVNVWVWVCVCVLTCNRNADFMREDAINREKRKQFIKKLCTQTHTDRVLNLAKDAMLLLLLLL